MILPEMWQTCLAKHVSCASTHTKYTRVHELLSVINEIFHLFTFLPEENVIYLHVMPIFTVFLW